MARRGSAPFPTRSGACGVGWVDSAATRNSAATVVDLECVYTEVSKTLNVNATLEGGDDVTLIFTGLPYPGYFDVVRFPKQSSDAETVSIVGDFAGLPYASSGEDGIVEYDDSVDEAFSISTTTFVPNPGTGPSITVAGDLVCEGVTVK